MIRRVKEKGTLRFSFVACDDFYGQQPDCLSELRPVGVVYMADVPVDTRVYRHRPTMGIPTRNGNRGRSPSRPCSLDVPLERLDQIAKHLPHEAWKPLKIRHTERGNLMGECAALRVITQQSGDPEMEQWVVFRPDLSGAKTSSSRPM